MLNTVHNIETQTVRPVTFLAQYPQIRNFTKHIFKKHMFSCHNLFLLRKRGPTWYLTLQEDHIVSICGLFFNFEPVGPNMKISSKAPQKGKISSFFFNQSLTDNMAFLNWSY